MLCILLLAVSETVELLLLVIVASKDDQDDTLFSVVLAFINVDVDEVADGGTSSVVVVVGMMLVVAFFADTVTDVEGLLFLSITGDCSRSELVDTAGGVGFGGTAVAVGLSKPLLRRCSTTWWYCFGNNGGGDSSLL